MPVVLDAPRFSPPVAEDTRHQVAFPLRRLHQGKVLAVVDVVRPRHQPPGAGPDLVVLHVLPPKFRDPGAVVRGLATAAARIHLSLPNPPAQRLCRTAELGRDRDHGLPLGGIILLVVEDHPNCPLADLWGVSTLVCSWPHPLKEWSLR